MTPSNTTEQHRAVIVGGGIAGFEALLALHAIANDRVDVTLVSDTDELVYRPLSTGEPFDLGPVRRYDVGELTAAAGAEFVRDRLDSVAPESSTIRTEGGDTLSYDSLLLAVGGVRTPEYENVLTFRDERDSDAMRALLDELQAGDVRHLAFLVPSGVVWPLPLYELALMTGELVQANDLDVELTLVTPAMAPLALFGEPARAAMADLLEQRGIRVVAGVKVRGVSDGRVQFDGAAPALEFDRAVALPFMRGPFVKGVPHDPRGFIPTDEHARVIGIDGVYAAGDGTSFPLKQGGLAAQQADAAAEAIAAAAGATDDPAPFRPVLRGMLLTGGHARWMRSDAGHHEAGSAVSDRALWWPPTKVAGRYLAPALGSHDVSVMPDEEPGQGRVPVEVVLDTLPHGQRDLPEGAVVTPGGVSGPGELVDYPPVGQGL